MKLLHIRSRKACDIIMRKGQVWKGKTMIVRWLPGAPRKEGAPELKGLYLGTYASGKLDKSAVKRNRMRRRCREAFRRLVKNQDDLVTAQLLVTPKIGTLVTPFEQIESDVRTFLSATNTWQNPKRNLPASSTSR